MNAQLLFLFCLVLMMQQKVFALLCYEKNAETGKVEVVNNPEWTYCMLVPVLIGQSTGMQSGLGSENDLMTGYDSVFDPSSHGYRVLSICMYEKYEFAYYPAEFLYRCICNYNLCNSETNFGAYLKTLKKENTA